MMTDVIDGVEEAVSCVGLWRGQVELAAMISNHLYSGEIICDISDDDSLPFGNLDTRKRKELCFGELDAAFNSDLNKRTKYESSEYSGASFDTHSNMVEVLQGKKPTLLKNNFVVTSPQNRYISAEQGTSAEELGAGELDTSFCSTDNENTGDDDYSRCDTSTFSTSEEGLIQRPQCCEPYLHSGRHISANKQLQYQRDDSWSRGSNFLHSQLGSFIHKEKLKLESEFEEGHSGVSRRSLRGSVCGYGSIEPVAGIRDDRLLGSIGSLSGFVGATNSLAQRDENTGYHGEIYSSRTSCMLLSYVGNKKLNGFYLSMKKDEVSSRPHSNIFSETEEQVFLTDSVQGVSWPSFSSAQLEEFVHASGSTELHQKYVLSSGRLNNNTAAQEDTRDCTIDRDFDNYFAKLIL